MLAGHCEHSMVMLPLAPSQCINSLIYTASCGPALLLLPWRTAQLFSHQLPHAHEKAERATPQSSSWICVSMKKYTWGPQGHKTMQRPDLLNLWKRTYFFFQSLIIEKKWYPLNVFRFKPLPRREKEHYHWHRNKVVLSFYITEIQQNKKISWNKASSCVLQCIWWISLTVKVETTNPFSLMTLTAKIHIKKSSDEQLFFCWSFLRRIKGEIYMM